MNIVQSIVDIIGAALFWALGLILGREPAGGEAFRLLILLLALAMLAAWLGPRWRRLLYRWRFIRRRFLHGERYAGHYIQAIQRGEAVRYAIVRIFYNAREARFEADGRTYNPSGEAVSSFRSAFVLLPTDKNGEIEYIWEGSRAASGYTCMKAEGSDGDLAEGEGYINVFGPEPKGFRLQFKELEDAGLRETIGLGVPAHAKDERGFVKKFHKEFAAGIMEGFAPGAEEVP